MVRRLLEFGAGAALSIPAVHFLVHAVARLLGVPCP